MIVQVICLLVCCVYIVDADVYDCSEAGFAAGLTAGGLVQFNCASPSIITLSPNANYTWSSVSTIIDGQDNVTIDGTTSSWYIPSGSAHSVRDTIVTLRDIGQEGSLTIERSKFTISHQISINGGVYSLEYSLLLLGAQETNGVELQAAGAGFRCLGSTISSAGGQEIPNTLFALVGGSSLTLEFCTAANFATFAASPAVATLSVSYSVIFGQLTGLTPSSSTNNVYQYSAYGVNDTVQSIQTRVVGSFAVPAGGKYESYALVPCSPAINAATVYVGMPATDQHGRQRTQSGAPDTGAYESTLLPCVSIVGAPFTIVETQGAQTLNVQVSLSGKSTIPVSVQYATSDVTAADGSDYTAVSGTTTFTHPTTLITIPITILGDNIPELSESLLFTLSSPVNAGIVTASASIVITDNDRNVVSLPTSTIVVNDDGNNTVIDVVFDVVREYNSVPVNVTVSVAEENGTKSYYDVTFVSKINTVKSLTHQINSTFANYSRVFDILIESAVNADISTTANSATITLTAYPHCGGGNTDVCSIYATCTNTTTALNCTCVSGYYGDGYVCTPSPTMTPSEQPPSQPPTASSQPTTRAPTRKPTTRPTIIPTTPPTGPPTVAATVEPPLDLIISIQLWDTLKDVNIEWLLVQYRARSVVSYIVEVFPAGTEPVVAYNGSATNITLNDLSEGTTYVVTISGFSQGLPLAISSTNFTTPGVADNQIPAGNVNSGLSPGAVIGLVVALISAFLVAAVILIIFIVKHQSKEDKAKANSLFDPQMIAAQKNRHSVNLSLAGQGYGIKEDTPKKSHKHNDKHNDNRRDEYNRDYRKSREDLYRERR